MTLLRGVGRGLLFALGGAFLLALAVLTASIGTASAAQATALGDSNPFHQCPPVGSDTGCAQLIVVNANGSTSVLVDPIQGPYDGSDDTLIGVQNNSGHSLSKLNVGSPSGSDIFGFDGDGICYPANWPAATTQNTPPGCPNPVQGVGFGPTGYEGPGTSFSTVSSNLQTGAVNFSPALKFGGSAYFGLEEALTAGQLRASQVGPIPGPFTVSGRSVQFQLTCVGTSGCKGRARLVVKQHGSQVSGNVLTGKGRLVIIGSVAMSISSGSTSNVVIKPNTTGNQLLKRNRNGFKTTVHVVSNGATYSLGLVKLP